MDGHAAGSTSRSRSPRTHIDSQPLPTDSMVTVPLSEAATEDDFTAPPLTPRITVEEQRFSSRPSSAEILRAFREPRDSDGSIVTPPMNSPTISLPGDDEGDDARSGGRSRSGSNGSEQVDWTELEKKEVQKVQDGGQDDEVRAPSLLSVDIGMLTPDTGHGAAARPPRAGEQRTHG